MRAIILFLTLISNLSLAREPSEVAEIRKIYQKTKEEINATQKSPCCSSTSRQNLFPANNGYAPEPF